MNIVEAAQGQKSKTENKIYEERDDIKLMVGGLWSLFEIPTKKSPINLNIIGK